jgi:SPP1 gp7 family putative phage head morphogenesis protein|uniref:Minor capsid protein n=1 Tax=Siphoviridae sp. ctnNB1 TaxID=2825660 RepID=A0A8S5UVD6_9CAUD|nr:MAG TPA: minor capsid protein [Siphoviridae sp. ctnNB1]
MSYWTNRQKQLKKTAEKDEEKLKKRLSSFYDSEFKRLDKEIAAYFTKYGEDNVIEYRTLMQNLSDEDKRLLIEQMDEFARKYPQYADLMPIRESIYKLDRLQGLQYSVFMAQSKIAGYTNEQVKQYETSLAHKGLNYAMETLGFGKNFYSINADIVKQFVGVPWSNGENFSTRIWNDTQKLANYLNQDMAQMLARGDGYNKIVQNLKKRFDRVNRNNAYRLVYTEGTYVMAESTIQPFTEDFEQYRLSPVLDGRTCPICRGLQERTFNITDRKPGTNFPPIHPWCRCSFEIVVDDWDAWMDNYEKTHTKKQAKTIENRLREDDKHGIITVHKSLGAAAKRYGVKLVDGQGHTRLAEGQTVTGKTFAGKGTNTEIRDRFRLESDYHIPANEWEKVSGEGYVMVDGKRVKAELHWYEADGEIYEMKIKRYIDEG